MRKVRRDLAHSSPGLRASELSLSFFGGLVLAFQLLPLWVGVGFVGVIARHIALAVSSSIQRH